MIITCEKCQGKFKIPDDKIPKGKVFYQACPKCDNKISIDTRQKASPPSEEVPDGASKPETTNEEAIIDEVDSGAYDAGDKPFDFVEEGVETSMICEPDPVIREKIRATLENFGYHTMEADTPKDVLKQMRFHTFDIVVLNERFGTRNPDMNNILKYLDRLTISIRRNIFVVLLTDRFRTMDYMVAFNKSVNLIVNLKNINDIEKILKRGVADYASFYRVLRESLIKTGRI
ncbi:MAG: zinc-ribbon domain-containing protein [Desulfobacterales bacterium]|nr:MAG: zinc-ribbon domain-containing protein [Desulfobacterales bacterium]